jgi:GDP-mannose 6-dehydrogenase
MARVSVFGLGYVGAVTAACLTHKGHEVTGVDVNPLKIEMMESGQALVRNSSTDILSSLPSET